MFWVYWILCILNFALFAHPLQYTRVVAALPTGAPCPTYSIVRVYQIHHFWDTILVIYNKVIIPYGSRLHPLFYKGHPTSPTHRSQIGYTINSNNCQVCLGTVLYEAYATAGGRGWKLHWMIWFDHIWSSWMIFKIRTSQFWFTRTKNFPCGPWEVIYSSSPTVHSSPPCPPYPSTLILPTVYPPTFHLPFLQFKCCPYPSGAFHDLPSTQETYSSYTIPVDAKHP